MTGQKACIALAGKHRTSARYPYRSECLHEPTPGRIVRIPVRSGLNSSVRFGARSADPAGPNRRAEQAITVGASCMLPRTQKLVRCFDGPKASETFAYPARSIRLGP